MRSCQELHTAPVRTMGCLAEDATPMRPVTVVTPWLTSSGRSPAAMAAMSSEPLAMAVRLSA